MTISLFQLSKEYDVLLSQLYNRETGEVNQEIEAQINSLSMTTEKKCLSIASYIKNLESDKREIEFLKDQIKERERAYDKEIERLQNYLKYNMEKQKMSEISCPYFTIKIKTNPWSTDIIDESQIPEKYMTKKIITKEEIKPNKNLIKEDVLKTNIQIPGAIVKQNTKLEISITKI